MALKKINYHGSSKVIIRLCEMVNQLIDGGGGGSKHTIINASGTSMSDRAGLQFTGATVTDDSANDKTVVAIPTALSSFTNDSGFITSTVNNLTNYYLKTETYTQAEVNSLISAIVTLNILVVQTLPTQDISTTTIYLVTKQTPETQDIYDEYIYVNNAWEHIGSTQIDLSNYYTKTETDNLLGNKVDKVTGKQLSTEDFTSALKSKLEGIASGAEVNVQPDWSQTDNTQDDYIKNKPQNLVTDANYVHTDNNYSTAEKNKLSGIATGAEVNVQSDWNQTDNTADDFIKNKPTIPSGGGHTILDNNDTEMTQRPDLQFKGIDVSDDSTNEKTVADVSKMNESVTIDTHGGYIDEGGFQILSLSALTLGNNIASGDGASFGRIDIYGTGQYKTTIGTDTNTDDRSIILPDEDGYIALNNQTFTEASTRANIASGESFKTILGKIKKFFTDLKTVAFTGAYNDLSGKPSLATVATSGSYSDLSNKPTIPSVGNGTITIKQAGASKGTFTTNQSGNTTIELTDNNTTYSANNGVGLSGTTFYNSGVRAVSISGNNLRVNTNGSNSDLTIPYATSAGSATDSTKVAKAGDTMSGTLTINKRFVPGTTAISSAQIVVKGDNNSVGSRGAIGFTINGVSTMCCIYMGGDGALYARWNDGTEKKIVGK